MKAAQQILCESWPDNPRAGDSFAVGARATSGLPVSTIVLAGPALIAGSRVTFLRPGEVRIKITQDGNEEFDPAPDVVVTFNVTKAHQTIAVEALPSEVFSGDRIVLKAAASSQLPVSFRVLAGPATLSGGRVAIITGPGSVEIEVSQPGNDKLLAAKTTVSLRSMKRRQEILFDEVHDGRLEDAQFTLRATSTSGLPVSLSLVSGQAKIKDNQLTLTEPGPVVIRVVQAGDSCYSPAEVVRTVVAPKRQQAIRFEAAPGAVGVGDAHTLQASASSGLPVTFSVLTGKASLTGNQLTPKAAGSVTIKAIQAGDENYEPAEAVQSLTVVKARQTLDFKTLPGEVTVGDRCILEAVASSGLTPVTFTLVSGTATISGHQLRLKGAGLVAIKAAQAGNEMVEAAEAEQFVLVLKAKQTIRFEAIPREASVGESLPVRATAESGLPVSISVVSGLAEIADGQLTLRGAGEVKIKATQSGDENHAPAPELIQTVTAVKARQTIQFDLRCEELQIGDSIPLSATASSGQPVTFRVVSGSAEVKGGSLVGTGAGRVEIEAEQPGDDKYLPAKTQQSLLVIKRPQQILLEHLRDRQVGELCFMISATATSGLPVTFRVVSGPAEIKNNEVTLTGAGAVVIKAVQPGDSCYNPAEVIRSFVAPKRRQTIEFDAAPGAVSVGDSFTLQARASSGLPVTFSVLTGKASLAGNRLTADTAGTLAIKATQTGNENYEPAEAVQRFTVLKARQTLDFKALPRELIVGDRCTLEAVASSGLTAVTFSLVSGPAKISGQQLALKGAGLVVIKATQAGNERFEAAEAQQSVLVLKAKQSISFEGFPREAFADESFAVGARAGSELPVHIAVVSGPAEIVDGRLTLQGAGEVKLKATQSGDENYAPAPEVVQTLTVVKARQTIRFDLTAENLPAGASILLDATASSGRPVTFRLLSGPGELRGNTLVGTAAGEVQVEAEQAGDHKYQAAKTQTSLRVVKRSQEIVFEALKDRKVGDAPFVINATASSDLPVSLSVASGPAKIRDREIILTGAGRVVIKAAQAGDSRFAAAEAEGSFTVAKGRQAIQIDAPPGALIAGAACALQARASSGLPVTLSVQTGMASLAGDQITPKSAGSVTIKATQAGNENFEPAEALQSFTVAKARQTLSFKALPKELPVGSSCTMEAVASSGLAVTFSLVSGTATLSGPQLTLTAAGTLVIKALQAGSEVFAAAEAEQSLSVLKAEQTISFDGFPREACAGESFPVRATSGSGLPVSISVVSGPAAMVEGRLTLHGAGDVKIKATQSGDENHAPAPEVVLALTAIKARQSIRFDLACAELGIGDSTPLSGTATSGLPVSFRVVSGPAELKGNTLVGTRAGRVEIEAEQPGDDKYLPAKTQRSLLVTKHSQKILFDQLRDRQVGEAPFVIRVTATSGLPVTFSVVSGPAEIKDSEVTLTGAGRVVIKAIQPGDNTYTAAEAGSSFSVGKGRQTIRFDAAPATVSIGETCTLQASASSGLPVTFSVLTGKAALAGNQLSPKAAGSVTIKAIQAGDQNYEPAEALQSFTIARARQTLDFKALPRELFVGDRCTLEAVASSGLTAVTFSLVSGRATISGHQLALDGAGLVGIKAAQAGNETFEAAEAGLSVLVFKANQAISFDGLPREASAGESFPVRATAGSGLPVRISVVSGPAEIVDGQLTLHGAGEVKIKATQTGDENYAAAPEVVQTLTAVKARQTIQFDPTCEELQIGDSIMLTATASSGQPVSFRVLSGPAELKGDSLIGTGAGRVEIEAEQLGDDKYLPAKTKRSLVVAKRPQEILFAALHDSRAELAFRATSTSGLPVSLSLVSGQAKITENEVTLTGAGPVVIKALQPGDSCYNPTEVVRSFVAPKKRQTIKFDAAQGVVRVGDTCTLQASASSGLPVAFSILTGKARLEGNRFTPEGVGTITIKATQTGNNDYEPIEAVQSLMVVKARQTLDFKTLPGEVTVGDRCALEAVASSGLTPVTFTLVSGTATISGHQLRLKGAGLVAIKAAQAGNEMVEAAEAEQFVLVLKAKQTIRFEAIPREASVGESLPVRATAESGLPVSISVVSGLAEIADGQLTLRGAGEVKIKATQSGDENHAPAPELIQTVTAVKARQTIQFDLRCEELQIGDSIPLSATASSGQPVTFRVVSGPAQVKGGSLVGTGGGCVEIEAEQPGDDKYLPAKTQQSLLVIKHSQQILFEQLSDKHVGEPPFIIRATATSALPVTFSVVSGPAWIRADEVTVSGAGRVVIKAIQNGDNNYAAAEAVSSFSVGKGRQTIRFDAAPGVIRVGDSCKLQASASSGLPVTFSVLRGNASITGDQLTPEAAGTVTIRATQTGNERFEAAQAEQSVSVLKAKQTISFDGLPSEGSAGESFPVQVTSGSGLPVSIEVVSGPAEIVDGRLTLHGAGEVKIKATQSGDENYAPAPEVVQTLTAVKARQTIRFDLEKKELQIGDSILLTATASSGEPVAFRLVSGPAELYGDSLVGTGAGRVEIEVEQPGDDKYLPAETRRSLRVVKRSQEIQLERLWARKAGEPAFSISAKATSGLPVTFSVVSGPASISGCEVILSGWGKVRILASQPGDDRYESAPDVEGEFDAKDSARKTWVVVAGALSIGAILVLGVFLLWPTRHPSPKPTQAAQKAQELSESSSRQQTDRELALAQTISNSVALLREGKPEAARELIEKVLQERSGDPAALALKAQIDAEIDEAGKLKELQQLTQLAQKAESDEQWPHAVELLKQALSRASTFTPSDAKYGQPLTSELSYAQNMEAAQKAFSQGNYAEAINQADAALAVKSADASANKIRADAQNSKQYQDTLKAVQYALQRGNYADAISQADAALRIKSNAPEATKLKQSAQQGQQTYQGAMKAFKNGDYASALSQCQQFQGIDLFDRLSAQVGQEQNQFNAMQKALNEGNYAVISGKSLPGNPLFDRVKATASEERSVLKEANQKLTAGDFSYIELIERQSYAAKPPFAAMLDAGRKAREAMQNLQKTNAVPTTVSTNVSVRSLSVELNDKLIDNWEIYFGLRRPPAGSDVKAIGDPTQDSKFKLDKLSTMEAEYAASGALNDERKHRINALRWLFSGKKGPPP